MLFDEAVDRTPIDLGWSGDQKYRITCKDRTQYLVRISPMEKYERRKRTFEIMQRLYACGVPMCRPAEFSVSNPGVCTVLGWVDGEAAESAVPLLPETTQYALGQTAGRILLRIHSIPAPDTQANWETRFNAKIDRNIRLYDGCGAPRENVQPFIDYINANRSLLKNRPQCYQHGDYHLGNMLLDNAGKLTVIDFDRDDFGDPFEEFNRIVWSAETAPRFACGLVDGYFNGSVPPLFWRLMALYVFSNQLSSVPWAMQFGQEQVDIMQKQARKVMLWYDSMQLPVPKWYRQSAVTPNDLNK